MRGRELQIGLALVAAAGIGLLIGFLVFGGDNGSSATVATTTGATTSATTTAAGAGTTSATTTTTGAGTAPTTPAPTEASCIQLWNEPINRGAQTYVVNVASQQPIRVHVGETSEVPPKCLVTIIGNNGTAWVFAEAGGTTYPYTPSPSQTTGSSLPTEQRTANALEQRDGTLAAS
jgi:hypothetical protein